MNLHSKKFEAIEPLINQQIAYYQARASEYDEWFLRQGRYDHGPALNQQWFREVELVRSSLEQFHPAGRVLELACGTGLWTQQLLPYAEHITAVDAASEVIRLNQQRLNSHRIEYTQADIFKYQPLVKYDVIFFSFWLSHVPPQLFEHFWETVARAAKPQGRVFFIDSKHEPTSTAHDHKLGSRQETFSRRRLNDGSEYEIVKIFYQADQLAQRLDQLGWRFDVSETASYFIYGSGKLV